VNCFAIHTLRVEFSIRKLDFFIDETTDMVNDWREILKFVQNLPEEEQEEFVKHLFEKLKEREKRLAGYEYERNMVALAKCLQKKKVGYLLNEKN
jgi:flavin reductase (DIM6/NTAB) family NADH-FMN oxidoreductase RutF